MGANANENAVRLVPVSSEVDTILQGTQGRKGKRRVWHLV